jgi:hypothetical protein
MTRHSLRTISLARSGFSTCHPVRKMRTDGRDLKVSMNMIESYLTQTILKGKVI